MDEEGQYVNVKECPHCYTEHDMLWATPVEPWIDEQGSIWNYEAECPFTDEKIPLRITEDE